MKNKINSEVKQLYWTFNCIGCNREIVIFSVREPDKNYPCSECILKDRKENV